MRKLLFVAVIALAPTACSKSEKTESANHEEDLPEISIEDVQKGIESKTLTVYDCNGDKTRKNVGVLPGAILIDDENTYRADVLPADKTAKLVFYCGGPG